jgi:hypothetical protein
MSNKPRVQARIERRYSRIRGDKKFRLPPEERSFGIDKECPKNCDQFDNNPGRTPPAPNPDKL